MSVSVTEEKKKEAEAERMSDESKGEVVEGHIRSGPHPFSLSWFTKTSPRSCSNLHVALTLTSSRPAWLQLPCWAHLDLIWTSSGPGWGAGAIGHLDEQVFDRPVQQPSEEERSAFAGEMMGWGSLPNHEALLRFLRASFKLPDP